MGKHRELQSIVIMRILLVAALFLFIVICIEGKATKLKTGGKHKKTLKSATKLKSNAAKEVSPKRRSDKTTKATATEEAAEPEEMSKEVEKESKESAEMSKEAEEPQKEGEETTQETQEETPIEAKQGKEEEQEEESEEKEEKAEKEEKEQKEEI